MYNLTVDEAHTFFVGDGQWLVHNQSETDPGMTRVGRWMSQAEYDAMISTGKVQTPFGGGGSYVSLPANGDAFAKQAKPGSVYVEFDVPSSSVVQTKDGWGYVQNPTTKEARLAAKKGLSLPENPEFKNISLGGCK